MTTPTRSQIAAMQALPAAIKAQNHAHEQIDVQSIGADTYIYIARGWHDHHLFMAAVREHCGHDTPLRAPSWLWMKTMPRDGYSAWYQPVPEGTRGAWRCTYTTEASPCSAYVRPSPAPVGAENPTTGD